MNKSKTLILSFLIGAVACVSINSLGAGLEKVFLAMELDNNLDLIKSQQASSSVLLDIIDKKPDISARAAISVLIHPDGKKELIFSKNSKTPMPIASISKVMSAYIITNYFDLFSGKPTIFRALSMPASTTTAVPC